MSTRYQIPSSMSAKTPITGRPNRFDPNTNISQEHFHNLQVASKTPVFTMSKQRPFFFEFRSHSLNINKFLFPGFACNLPGLLRVELTTFSLNKLRDFSARFLTPKQGEFPRNWVKLDHNLATLFYWLKRAEGEFRSGRGCLFIAYFLVNSKVIRISYVFITGDGF